MRLFLYLLYPLSLLYQFLFFIDKFFKKKNSIPNAFTISVGNLTTGGTGKTPLTIYIAGLVHSIFPEKEIVVLSRGYRGNKSKQGMKVEINSNPADSGDEPLLIKAKIPYVDVIIGRDRFKSYLENENKVKTGLSFSTLSPLLDINGRFSPRFRTRTRKRFFISPSGEATENHTTSVSDSKKIVLLDDGFQHHAIKRDLDFVLVDSNNAFGTGFTIPLGSLRERITAVKRAHYIIFTRYAKENASNVEILKVKFIKINPDLKFYNLTYLPLPLLNYKREILSLESLTTKKVVVFSALGNPFSFENLIESSKPKEIKKIRYPDHFAYDTKTMLDLFQELKNFDLLICTEKDYIKIQHLNLINPEMEKLYILPVEVYLNKQSELKSDLERLIKSKND
ncbi:MAG: tetraacyldisaccharide 4'-kinase [Leptospiraceae bacterium]|nr:tetraacyldisaccharide 4'-kinase [Leptospiraceae bacterium]